MFYTIKHVTRFRYSAAVSEGIMELRMQPRDDGGQRSIKTQIQTIPRARIQHYRDFLGNVIHHFDVPGRHAQLTVTAESFLEAVAPPPLPEALEPEAWAELDALTSRGDQFDYLMPSQFAAPTAQLHRLAAELGATRSADPLTLLRELNSAIYQTFDYEPESTRVDSPIDDALRARKGVCQDFTHIMIALLREIGIPARYISGYLYHSGGRDRSTAGATHAWAEALLPGLGWVGFDPTNDLLASERHVRVAIGRDYADVPPTRGVFKGKASQALDVSVRVAPSDAPQEDVAPQPATGWVPPAPAEDDELTMQQGQQQQ